MSAFPGQPAPEPEAEGVEFEVGEGGSPKLTPEGEDAPPPSSEVSGPQAALVVSNWTPEEAAAMLSALFNIGVMVYGPEWVSHPAEFRASGTMAAPLLDRYVPKQAGGIVTTGAGLFAVSGEMAGAMARRYPIIKRGPRPVWAAKKPKQEAPFAGAESEGGRAGDVPPPTDPPPSHGSNGGGSGYHIPKDLLKVVRPGLEEPLAGLGI